MAKNVGEKPKRITHLGNSSSSSSKMKLKVDYIQDIINDMDSMKHFNHSAQYENALKFLRNKPVAVPNAPENPPEYNIHGTKLIKTVASSKYHPLMAKCQKNLKYLLHNRSIPKARAHIKKIPKSPLKKTLPKFGRSLTNNESSLSRNEKMQQRKTLEASKRFPKPESDLIKSCQPAKKVHINNSIRNVSEGSKQRLMVSKKIEVIKKKVKSCSLPDDKNLNHCTKSNNACKLSEKDTDDDFETFVTKHKGKRTKKSRKKITDSSSDEEVESEKSKYKCKRKKARKTKCLLSEKTTKKISLHESRRKRPGSHPITETNKSYSDKQISDVIGKVKCRKKETCSNTFLQNESGTVKFNHPKEIKRSGYSTESSESEAAEMFSNNICSTSSDECSETAVEPLKINVVSNTNKMSEELTKKTIIHDGSERRKLNVSNDTSVDLKDEESVIFKSKKIKHCIQKISVNSKSMNILDSVSQCSVLIKRDHDIDKQARTAILNSKDSRSVVINNSCSHPLVNNQILIEISDEEGQIESDSIGDCKCFSDLPLSSNDPNNSNIDVNSIKKVQVEETIGKTISSTNPTASYTKNKIPSDKEDSDVEIIQINTPTCSVGKHYQNGTSDTNSACISPEKKMDLNDNVKKSDQASLKAVEQLNSCEQVSFGVSKHDIAVKENLKVPGTQGKLQDVNTSLTVAVGSNEDEVTVIETFYAEDQKKTISKSSGHVITTVEKEQAATINKDFILSSDKNKCEELSKTDDEEFVKPCSKSTGESANKEINSLFESDINKTECNSSKRPIQNNLSQISLSKSVNVPISDEDDCVILEPTSCVTKELEKFYDVPLQRESLNSKSISVLELDLAATPKNTRAKLSSSSSPENTENGFLKSVAKHAIPVDYSSRISDSSLTKLSKTSESKEFKDLERENDCIILDDTPVEVLTQEVKHDSSYKDEPDKEFIKSSSSELLNCITASKSATVARPCKLNQIESSLQNKQTLTDFSSVCSAKNILSNINKDVVCDTSIKIVKQTFHFKNEENSLIKNITKCLQKPIEHGSASNVALQHSSASNVCEKFSFVKSENSCSHQQNRLFVSDARYIKEDLPSINVGQNIQCKVENEESLPVESSLMRNLNVQIPFVNEFVQYSNNDVNLQKRLEISKNLSCDIDKKPVIYPNLVSSTGDKIDISKNCTLNFENPKELKKETHCNISSHPAVFHHNTSNIPHSNEDLPCSGSLNTIDLDSSNSLKTLESKNFLNSSLNELDAVTESSIYELSCTENQSLLPLLNLYKNEVNYYQKLKQTVKNVDAGIRSALDLQAERLKHLSFSIKNIVENDPCFSNSFKERSHLPVEHKQVVDYCLPDNVLHSSAKDLKKIHSSKNVNDFSSSAPSYSNLRNVNPGNEQTYFSSSCHKSPINFDNIPQLSLESLHENSANCVENIQQVSIKSELTNEISENEYFEEEIKYSKSSSFNENQPEALQDLRNSKCCVCNKPAIGACYFCCRVFYCSVECSECPIGKHHRAACSKEYTRS